MKGQMTATAAALALALAGPAFGGDDDRAVPKGGSSGGSSDAGSRHHGGGGSGSSSGGSSSSYSGPSSSGSGSGAWSAPPMTDAQRRHPRAGTGTGGRNNRGGGGYYYDPRGSFWYDRYYWNGGLGWHYGYSPFYYSGLYGYYPYDYNRRYYSNYRTGAVRVMVEPRDTRVYVDGYYAGIADDFDGLFQRLNLSSGRHDLTLKLEGHRTYKLKVYVPLDQTVKIRHRMAEGTGEEAAEVVVGRPDDYARDDERPRRPRAEDLDDEAEMDADYVGEDGGTLRLAVSPADASVYVDGDFKGQVRQVRRLRLSPGKHRVEVVRPGYRTLEREVDIRPGRATDLEIDLDRS
jgi:hypothetical protein